MFTYTEYDFSDKNTLLNIVKRDKHSFLEGACTEHIFYEDVFKSSILKKLDNAYYGTGWWKVKLKNSNEYILFNVSINEPNAKDIYIGKLFNNHQVYYLYQDDNNEITIYNLSTNTKTSLAKFMSKNKMKLYNNFKADESSINLNRQEKAIYFLEKNNLLKEYAFQRFFVNFILGENTRELLNIDAIVLYEKDSNILTKVFEVKFKYPSRTGHFGLNRGFNNLFEMILEYNIPINHYILHNGTEDKNVSIINAISDDDIKSKCPWIYTNIDRSLLGNTFQIASNETIFNGLNKQEYSTIPKNKFTYIKTLEYEYRI